MLLKSLILSASLLLNSIPADYPKEQKCLLPNINVDQTIKDWPGPYASLSGDQLDRFKQVWKQRLSNTVPESDLMLILTDTNAERSLIAVYRNGCSVGAVVLPSQAVRILLRESFATETNT